MKKRIFSIFCALALCLGLLPGTAWAAEEVSYVEYSWNKDTSTLTSETKSVSDYTTVTSSHTAWGTSGQTTWYVVSDTVANYERSNITVSGTVNLILTSGKTLTLNGPNISLQNSSAVLNIYGQAGNTGKLSVTAGNSSGDAGINLNGGTLNIHGGKVNATGYTRNSSDAAPGIDVGGSGTLTVYDGTVTATGGTASNSIGRGAGIRVISSGTVSIYGGTVTATGASNKSANGYPGAGIGGNGGSSAGETCGTVNIYGGTVTATGGSGGNGASAGIGGGQGGTTSNQGGGGNVTITGGTVTAIGGESTSNVQAPGIGGAVYSSSQGNAGSFSTGENGSAVITTTGGIQASTSGCSAIIDNKVYGNVTLPDSQYGKSLTVSSRANLTIPDGAALTGSITVESGGTLTVNSGSTVTNTGTITVESGGTLTGGGTIQNTSSGTVTGGTGDVKVTYPSTVTVTSEPSGTAGPNQSVTFTATVTGNDTAGTPTGTVQFKDNGNDLGTAQTLNNEGKATYTTSNLEIGEHKITAVYSGDGSYTAKTSSELTFTVVGDVASISIETQPKKMTYTTGETLDLSDLVITVHYVGSTYTQDIIWSADSGITASIENGTTLYASQHDGQTITITYGDKTATTGNLTVARANPQVTAPTAKFPTYTGAAQELVNKGTTTGGEMQYSLTEDGTYTPDVPTGTDAGQYTVYYKVVGNDDYNDVAAQSVSVTIAKANAQVTAAPKAVENLAFTGLPQNLVTAGSATGGTLVYSLTGNENDYSTAIPTATNVGEYTVYYKVQGDENYNDTEAKSVTAVIGNALAEVTKAPDARELTYTGDPQELVTEGTATGGEIQYSLSKDSGYSATVPTGTVADDYSVWYYVKGDDNHSDTDPVQVEVTIKKADPDVTVPDGLTATYGDTLANVDLTDGWAWDAPNTSVGDVGENTFSATFTPSDTANYNTVTENLTVTVSAKDITGAVITLGDSLTYTGQEQTQQIASVTVDGLTVTYTVTGNTGTDADSYTLTVTGTGNFTGTATKEWTIAKANYNGTTGVSGTVLANWSDKVTLPTIPDGASYGAVSYGGKDGAVKDLSIEGGVLSYTGGESITVDQAYKITVQVDGGKNYEDYTITVTLTGSDKQTLTITGVTAQGGTYNGQAQAGYTGTPSAEGYDGGFTVTYGTTDGQAPTDAGTYTVTIAIPDSDPQYVGSTTLDFTIAKKALTVSAPSKTITVGDTIPDLSTLQATVTGLVGEDTFSGVTLTYDGNPDNSQPGTWDIVPSDGEFADGVNGDNYTVSYVNGTLTVEKKPVSGSGTSGGTTTPSGPSTGGSDGWTEIEDEVDETPSGSTVTVDMNGTTEVPAEVFEAVAGKDVTLELDMGGGVKWEINSQDIPANADLTDLNLGVTMNTSDIPVDVINAVTGDKEAVQLTLAHNGEFGFTLTLTAPVGVQNKGLWANLYHYNTTLKQMLFETSAQVDASGNVALKFTHASEYAIVLDESSHELPFTDTAKGAWYQGAVEYVYRNGIMTGTSATTFEPNTTLSRAMVAQILYNLEGHPTVTGESTFTDSNTHWAAKAIAWAQKTGVVSGYGNNTFRPNRAVTREELAQMLYNYAKVKGYDLTASGDLIAFPDVSKVSDWAETAMSWANGNQLINGFEDDTLRPGGDSTRAQAASILMNFDLNVVKD